MEKTYKLSIDTKTFLRFWLVLIGLVIVGLLLFKASAGLLILGASLFFALAISPLVNKLASIIPGEGRKLPIALSYIIVSGFVAGFVAIVIPTVFNETQRFVSSLPEVFNNASFDLGFIDAVGNRIGISNMHEQIGTAINDFSLNFIKEFGNNLFATLGTVGNILTSAILILVLGFFMLVEGPEIVHSFWNNFRSHKKSDKIRTVVTRMSQVVSKYVSSAITVSLINACCTTITVFILSLCLGFSSGLALPLGLITGLMSLIPMFGSLLGGALVSILLAFNNWPAGLIFLAYTIIYLQIESNIISPKIQGKGMRLPALIVLASVTIGMYMFGLIGAIVSIPIAGCIKILLEEFGDGFLPIPEKPKTDKKKA